MDRGNEPVRVAFKRVGGCGVGRDHGLARDLVRDSQNAEAPAPREGNGRAARTPMLVRYGHRCSQPAIPPAPSPPVYRLALLPIEAERLLPAQPAAFAIRQAETAGRFSRIPQFDRLDGRCPVSWADCCCRPARFQFAQNAHDRCPGEPALLQACLFEVGGSSPRPGVRRRAGRSR